MAIITGTPNNDILVGTNEADTIRGLEGNDIISGLDGADQLDGGAGNDSIAGNLGNDSIFGGAGDDTLLGGQGDDLIIGEAGNDIIAGEAGTNTLTGGVGRDTFILTTRGKATITDFFAGDDLLGLSGDLTIDDVEVVQRFANTEVIDRRTGNVLASLTSVNAGDLRRQNFVDENGRPVNFNPAPATLVDVTATDSIAQATNPDDPIVFTVSRTNTVGDLTVNFTLSTTAGVTLQNPPTSVRIPAGQQFANVLVRPQNNSGNGTVTITLQDTPNYDVRTGTATGTVSAPIPAPTPAPAPAVPDAPPVVDLVLTRADVPATPSAGQPVTTTFNVFNRGTGKADRVELSANLPIDTRLVSVEPSQGVFTNFSGDSTRGGIVKVELGSIDPDRGAKVVVTYVPNTTGNFVLTDARVTSAQPDVDPSTNFANAGFNIIPSPPVLPVISVVASNDGVAREPDTTQLEGTDRETETGLVVQQFIISRRGGDLTRPLTVSYTLEGTAQNGVDFNPIGSSVTFAPFQTEVVVTIRPVQDRQVEGTEFVRLNLTPNPLVYNVNEQEGKNTARIEIVDVPNPVGPAPLFSVVSIVAIDNFAEESDGPLDDAQSVSPRRGVIRITRDNTVGNLEVNLEVTGTASPADYNLLTSISVNGLSSLNVIDGIARITIPDGSQFVDLIVTANPDNLSEGYEDVIVNVAPGLNYQIGRPQDIAADNPAVVRIRDNDTPPNISISVVNDTATEGAGDSIVFRVTRSAQPGATLDISTPRVVIVELPRGFTVGQDPDGPGPLTAPITFEAGTAGRPRQIQRNGPFDPDGEDYTVTGSTVFLGFSTLTTEAGGLIANLSQFPPEQTSNRFLVVIPAGETSADIVVTPINDRDVEATERVIARIVPPPLPEIASNTLAPSDIPPGGFIVTGGAAEGFILDGGAPTLEIIPIDPLASELSFKTATFEVRRTGNLANPLTVSFRILPSGATPAQPGQDFYAIPPDQVVIPAGQQSAFITIFPNDDLIGEGFEEFTIALDPVPGFSVRNNGRAIGFVTDEQIQVSFFLGTPSTDRIIGTSNNDFLAGNLGDDTIEGRSGNDVISGDAGNDRLLGEEGNDLLTGGSGDDTIDGGSGNDTIEGGLGVDVLTGGSGIDRFVFQGLDEIFVDPNSGVDIPDNINDFAFAAPDQDLIVLLSSGFPPGAINVGSTIDPAAYQAVNSPAAIVANANVRVLYVGNVGPQGSVGRLYFTPTGTVAGSLPGDERVIAQFTTPLGAPLLNFSQIQVLP